MNLRIMSVYHDSIVDGEGFRDVVFLNMCPHHCKGCHNPSSWDYCNGHEISVQEAFDTLVSNPIADVTLSGGEPFLQSEALSELCSMLRAANKNIWIYSGYLFEDIAADPIKRRLLTLCDVLVDGPFVQSLADKTLRFRGSSNQRIIDIKKSLKEDKVVLYDMED